MPFWQQSTFSKFSVRKLRSAVQAITPSLETIHFVGFNAHWACQLQSGIYVSPEVALKGF